MLEAGPDYGPFDRAALAGRPARLARAARLAPVGLRQRRDLWPAPARVRARAGDRRLLEPQRLRRDRGLVASTTTPGRRPAARAGARRACGRSSTARWRGCACAPTRDEETTPFHRACLEAAPRAGIPRVRDLNDWDEDLGIALFPINVADGVRWNAAFAYLDPVRGRPNLTIAGDVARLPPRAPAALGSPASRCVRAGQREIVECGRVVLAARRLRLAGRPAALRHRRPRAPARARHRARARAAGSRSQPARPSRGDRSLRGRRRGRRRRCGRSRPRAGCRRSSRSPSCGRVTAREGFDLHVYPIGGPSPERRLEVGAAGGLHDAALARRGARLGHRSRGACQ